MEGETPVVYPLVPARLARLSRVLFGLCPLALVATIGAGCSARDPVEQRRAAVTVPENADAATTLAVLRARPGSPLAATPSRSDGPPRARIQLPSLATGAIRIEDAATGAVADVTLKNVAAISGQTADGYVVYPRALSATATVLQHASPDGVEDYVNFDERPATTEIAYDVTPGRGIAGLRLVGNVLEMLDTNGAPRLRVAPPYIVGADGVQTDAVLAVDACAFDADPSPPWGRRITAPRAARCTVRVSWPASGVSYPAILDPRWTTTGSMITPRQEHTATSLSTGRVLVAGGRSGTGTTALASAELYDRTTGTWSATGSMTTGGRRLHTATMLATSGNPTTSGKVLAAGGINGTTTLTTAQLYSTTSGTWSPAGNLNTARHAHTATRLADGKVLLAGGMAAGTTLASASIYNPAVGSGSFAATTGPIPPQGLKANTATLLVTSNQQLNNKVLLVGGNNGTASIAAVYLFDPAQSAFSTLASIPSPREAHTAVLLPDGKLLVAGGKNGSSPLATSVIFDPGFGPGSWSTTGPMTTARWGHTATLLPPTIVGNGQVLVAGGANSGGTLASAELFSAGLGTWGTTPAMPGAAQGHTATLLDSNMVLVAGGTNGGTVLDAARLYDGSFGLGCSSASQCASGFCVGGVCCESACNGGCGACNLPGFVGTCKPLGTVMTCRAAAGVCDAAETCNGSSVTCPADALAPATTTCRPSAGACDPAETCTGTAIGCPADALAPATTTCRAAAGDCDVAEACTGSSASCPADAFKASATACADDGNVCTLDRCNGTVAACQHPAGNPGTVCRLAAGACDAAEACTGTSTACPADAFAPATTTCRVAAGSCDVAETCTGAAASCPADATAPNGAPCSDGNACTQVDSCQGGACTGSSPVVCMAQDQCHEAGVCNPSSGACSNPAKANGSNCTDSNACTQSDTCQGGTCTGANPVTCVALDQCHLAGSCNPSTGACSNPQSPNGAPCSDGNSCTSDDLCQAGTCTAGSPSCAQITVESVPQHTRMNPRLTFNLSLSRTELIPGDPLAYTATAANTGVQPELGSSLYVANTGTSTFTVGGYAIRFEYFSPALSTWVTLAEADFDGAGEPIPHPGVIPLDVLAINGGSPNVIFSANVVGTTIAAGATAMWSLNVTGFFDPATVATLFDPAQASQYRSVIEFQTSGGAVSDIVDVTSPLAGATGAIDSPAVVAGIGTSLVGDAGATINLTPTPPGPLASGGTTVFSGTIPGPVPPARYPNESEGDYRGRLGIYPVFGYAGGVEFSGTAVAGGVPHPRIDFGMPLRIPVINPTKSGPASGTAGLTLPYTVSLLNTGTARAGSFSIEDAVDGDVVTTTQSSITVEPQQAGTVTFEAPTPLARPAGPMTDVVAVTWKDPNGNTYGPLHSSFTTNLLAGHPEGYLSLVEVSNLPQLRGTIATVTALARDGNGQPVANLPVHFTLTGMNPQTADRTTGSDGRATFSYSGANLGTDAVVATATVATTPLQAGPSSIVWVDAVGAPCQGRADPLDVMLVIDSSGSMFLEGKIEAARVASKTLIDQLDPTRDTVGVIAYTVDAPLHGPLTGNPSAAKNAVDQAINFRIDECSSFCISGSDIPVALNAAMDELAGPRHRLGAKPVIVILGDADYRSLTAPLPDPTPAFQRAQSTGTRIVAVGLGSDVDWAMLSRMATSSNDVFYSPSGSELAWVYNHISQGVCRNDPPLVDAGGIQNLYSVSLPHVLTLHGEVHDDGPDGDLRLTTTWRVVSGPAPVTFTDGGALVTDAVFTEPGTYVLELEATDGFLTTADRATVTVETEPSVVGASLSVQLSAAGPMTAGAPESFIATLTNAQAQPIPDFPLLVTVTGANPVTGVVTTNASGVATFTYTGTRAGTDMLQAVTLGAGTPLQSPTLSVAWVLPGSGPRSSAKAGSRAPFTSRPWSTRSPSSSAT